MMDHKQSDFKNLVQRNGTWHYLRRVPQRYQHVDSRRLIKKTLKTKSIDVARMRRDVLREADDDYWLALAIEAAEQGGISDATQEVEETRRNW